MKGDQWLFVIGIDTYIEWPRLETAVNDAKAIRDILLSRYHFDRSHVIELYDEQATRKNIIGRLRELARNIRENDSLVIYYAGHGHLDTITKSGSWIPVESGIRDASVWISNNDIKNYLKVDAIKAKHVLLISDSCFSGDFFRGHRGKLPEVDDEVIKRAYNLTSRQAITSGGLEPVVDEGFGGHSVFSHFLIKTLKENSKPFLVPSDLFPEIKAGVAENAEQFPRFGSLVGTGGQQGGELVLFLREDSRIVDLAAMTEERERELMLLKQMENAAEEARKKEVKEIERYEQQIGELDKQIEQMRKRGGSTGQRKGDSLEDLLALVRQREEQDRKLKELERKRREEEEKRKAEIARLKEEQRIKFLKAFEDDVGKYLEIVDSKFGKDLKATAWKSLIERYTEGKALAAGDVEGLRLTFRGVGRLYVKTEPDNARIRILDIQPRFKQGLELAQGSYTIEVSASGYKTEHKMISLFKGENKYLNISLKMRPVETVSRDGKFLHLSNGVVIDNETDLEWIAGPDKDTNWDEAKRWVDNLTVAGGGWRMPNIEELKPLYQKGKGDRNMTPLLKTTGWWVWSGDTRGLSSMWFFDCNCDQKGYTSYGNLIHARAFAVRSRR